MKEEKIYVSTPEYQLQQTASIGNIDSFNGMYPGPLLGENRAKIIIFGMRWSVRTMILALGKQSMDVVNGLLKEYPSQDEDSTFKKEIFYSTCRDIEDLDIISKAVKRCHLFFIISLFDNPHCVKNSFRRLAISARNPV